MNMNPTCNRVEHAQSGVLPWFGPAGGDVLRVGNSRRGFLQTGLKGIAGLSLPALLRYQARASAAGKPQRKTSVILLWLSGGPSHIDMWDPKPDSPREIRGPFGDIPTKLPGVHVCEHLPLTAKLMDKLTILRSVDCSASDHTPITMQAGNPLARRTNDGGGYPSMGAVAAKFRGPNAPGMPGFVGLAKAWKSDVWGAGDMGFAFEPVNAQELAGQLELPPGLSLDRLDDRHALREQLDRLQRSLDHSAAVAAADRYTQQAYDVVMSGRAQRAFNLDEETPAMRDFYGHTSMGEKALLARRLVEAGVTFVLVSGAWGYFDHHGDNAPGNKWGGIEKGLKPLLPRVDQVLHALVTDLEQRGLLDSTLILMMGEFGRGPVINKLAGRDHWTRVMSMVMAGGGLRHGQVIGSTDRHGYDIANRPVSPADLAATVYQHLGIALDSHWTDRQGRPVPIVTQGGKPISELI